MYSNSWLLNFFSPAFKSFVTFVEKKKMCIKQIVVHKVSKETYHFFRATFTKIRSIKINHIWTQNSYSYPH